MIGSATRTTTGKKVIGIFVAIAMVLTMSNISAYYASADDDVKDAEENVLVEEEATEPETEDEEVAEPAATADDEKGDAVTEDSDVDSDVEEVVKTVKPRVSKAAVKSDDSPLAKDGDEVKKPYSIAIYITNKNATDSYVLHDTVNGSITTAEYLTPKLLNDEDIIEDVITVDGISYTLSKPLETYPDELVGENGVKGIFTEVYYDADFDGDEILDKLQRTVTIEYDENVFLPIDPLKINFPSTAYDATATVELPVVTVKAGYKFEGWYLGEKKIEGNTVDITMGQAKYSTLSCKAIKADDLHTFTYDLEFYVGGKIKETSGTLSYLPMTNTDEANAEDEDTFWIGKELVVKNDALKAAINSSINQIKSNPYYSRFAILTDTVKDDQIANIFDDPSGESTIAAHAGNVHLGTIKFFYEKDEIGDGGSPDKIADKYQIQTTFKVNHGTFSSGAKELAKVFTLYDENGKYSETGSYKVSLDYNTLYSVTPEDGYTNSKDALSENDHAEQAMINSIGWTAIGSEGAPLEGNQPQSGQDYVLTRDSNNMTFEYNFIPALQPYLIKVYDEDNAASYFYSEEGQLRYDPERPSVTVGNNGDIAFPIVEGYVVPEKNTTVATDPKGETNVFDLYYAKDAIGTEDVDKGDGIADKYQVKVVIKAINGTVIGNDIQVVTLRDANGQLSENGTGHLSKNFLAMPNTGFEGGKWSPATPDANFVITKNTTQFTITYSSISDPLEFVDDDEPNDDGDDNDNANADNAGNGTNIFVGPATPDAADAADEATEPEADEGEVIADDENPLVNLPGDQKSIADDENALAGYEEGSQQTWLPFAIVAGVLCAGLLLFLVARRKKDEEDARSAY